MSAFRLLILGLGLAADDSCHGERGRRNLHG